MFHDGQSRELKTLTYFHKLQFSVSFNTNLNICNYAI